MAGDAGPTGRYWLTEAQRTLVAARDGGAHAALLDLASEDPADAGDAERAAAMPAFVAAVRAAGGDLMAEAVEAAHEADGDDGWEAALGVLEELGVRFLGYATEVDAHEGDHVRRHETLMAALGDAHRLAA